MDSLNVCAGIDAGSYESKLAYSDSLSTRIIARLPGFDMNALREEAEAFFDEPVFSCVVALHGGRRVSAGASGFNDVETITASEALCLVVKGKALVYDLGASGCRMFMLADGALIESDAVDDVSGNEFDRRFAEYLAERFRVEAVDVSEARRIKHELSEREGTTWHEVRILREELERLIHFPVKRTARILHRMAKVHSPDTVIVTGGSVKIPCVMRTLAEVLGFLPEYRGNVIAEGAAFRAREQQKGGRQTQKADTSSRLRELRAGVISLEDKLTRRQKDRLYAMFRQAEGINDAGIIALMEKLIREIRSA